MNLTPDSSVRFLKGVGPARCEQFASVGVRTIRDLLAYYPRDYVFAKRRKVHGLEDGETAIVSGKISKVRNVQGRTMLELTDDSGTMTCTWFNQDFIYTVMRHRAFATLWGKVTRWKGKPQLVNPKYSFAQGAGAPKADGSGIPVYPATKKLTTAHIESAVKAALVYVDQWYANDDKFDMLTPRGFIRLNEAIRYIHQPCDRTMLRLAKRRLIYEEFYSLQECMKKRREQQTKHTTQPVRVWGKEIHRRIVSALHIDPTDDQLSAMQDIADDMLGHRPMYRLLQGDVGCGKTAVAIYASVVMAVNRKQTVVLCPTKVLAEQHYESWAKALRHSRFDVALLTSDSTVKDWGINVIVATTSVLSNAAPLSDVGLLIVDEEHRFGVKQKDKLVEKYNPHQLYMSATPIPKAIAMTAFGDLDVSTIKQMPTGRGRRETKVIMPHEVEHMIHRVDKYICQCGIQVYDIYPRIEGEGGLQEAWDNAEENPIGGTRGMVHGKCRTEDNKVMLEQFKRGAINVLMTTSMIEVGVNIPNANVMIIHEAHMFGLSQLHQLRGRIGRGTSDSICFLMCDTDDEAAIERLRFLEHTNDGFEVAHKDLELRGPGELLGTKQHGLPELKLADLITDYNLLVMAKEDVNEQC